MSCIVIVMCMLMFTTCTMFNATEKTELGIAATEAGLVQTMVKADGHDPKYIWVRPEGTGVEE